MYGGLSSKIDAVQGTQPGEYKVSMAEVKYSEKPGLISTFIWSGLHSGDRGEPILPDHFGVGGRMVIEVLGHERRRA
jgi:hypothetical protein